MSEHTDREQGNALRRLTPTELAREMGMGRRAVVVKCVELGVPIVHGRIEVDAFRRAMEGGTMSEHGLYRPDTPYNRLRHSPLWRGWECASHNIEAAPGYMIFVSGMLDGKRQALAIDPDEVDELTRRLHAAKRHARRTVVRGEMR